MRSIPLSPIATRHLKAQPLLKRMCHDLKARTQTEIAKDLGIAKSLMSEVLAGRRGVGPKLLTALERVYGAKS